MDKEKLKWSLEQWRKKLEMAMAYQLASAQDLKIASLTVHQYRKKVEQLEKKQHESK